MRSAKIISLAMAVFMLTATAAQAQKKTKKAAATKEIPITVIVMADNPHGGQDEALNAGLQNFFGTPLKITTVNREDALKDPKYKGLNLDYMPLYLIKRTPAVEEKFGQHIKNGMPATEEFVIFEKQTRHGVHAGRPRKPNVLEIFVMSQCPFGAMAEARVIDAKKLGRLPNDVQIDIKYIVGPGRGDEPFSSLHGTAEWEENVRQEIIKDKYPNKFWKYLEIRNKNYKSTLWDVAAEQAGINPKVFRKYWNRGVELLKQDMEYTQQLGIGASPTFLWEGQTTLDLNSVWQIKGLEGLAPSGQPASPAAAQAPAGAC
ncbi:MAG: hypothetical protein LBM71_04765 [Elusimicrobiota bacterium]|jgi:hypothetical protein|nr:hypothetical protein [Elusimicrobiota bacterium]